MKPIFGTVEQIEWLDLEDRGNDPWPTWTCHVCGAERTGAIIKNCENCDTYPRWRYNSSLLAVAKASVKAFIITCLYRNINLTKKLINKIDGGGHF